MELDTNKAHRRLMMLARYGTKRQKVEIRQGLKSELTSVEVLAKAKAARPKH